MKIQNKFANLINEGKKTIEIRKQNSLQKIVNNHLTKGLGSATHCIIPNGLLSIDIEIDDYKHTKKELELHKNEIQCECNFQLFFDGYQRIKVSELKQQISLVDKIKGNEDMEFQLRFKYSPDFWHSKLFWIVINNLNWLFEDYLKDEEYCVIYFINLEETFKANRWEEN